MNTAYRLKLVPFKNHGHAPINVAMHVPGNITDLHKRLWFTMTGFKLMAAARDYSLYDN